MRYLRFIILLLIPFTAICQDSCGTTMEDLAPYLELLEPGSRKLSARQSFVNEIQYYPVVHHIVRRSDGTGGLNSGETSIIMSQLNNAFDDAHVQFYSCWDIDIISNDYYFDYSTV